MPFINQTHPGLAYGDGTMQGNGEIGQFVAVAGNDLFTVNTDPEVRSFGMLIKSYTDGEMPGIFCKGGTYETDVFEGMINPGDDLKISNTGKLIGGSIGNNEHVVAQAISVQSGVLKFKLLI
jgi:hypothetical protein